MTSARPMSALGSKVCVSSGNPTATRGESELCSWTRTVAPSSCSRSRANGKWQRHELGNGGQHARQRLEGARYTRTVTHDPRPSRGNVRGLPETLPHRSCLCKPSHRGRLQLVLLLERCPLRGVVPRGVPFGAARCGGPRATDGARRPSLRGGPRGWRTAALLQRRGERAPRVPVVLPVGEQGAGPSGLGRCHPPEGGAAVG